MKKNSIISSLLLICTTYSSNNSVEITSGMTPSYHTVNGATFYSEALWFTLSVNYLSGGIHIAYPFGTHLTMPPVITITPIYSGHALEQVTPLIIENSISGITIVVTITSILGVIREANTNEVILNIFGVIPNENTLTMDIVSNATGLNFFNFGGTGTE